MLRPAGPFSARLPSGGNRRSPGPTQRPQGFRSGIRGREACDALHIPRLADPSWTGRRLTPTSTHGGKLSMPTPITKAWLANQFALGLSVGSLVRSLTVPALPTATTWKKSSCKSTTANFSRLLPCRTVCSERVTKDGMAVRRGTLRKVAAASVSTPSTRLQGRRISNFTRRKYMTRTQTSRRAGGCRTHFRNTVQKSSTT
mmetsp:Transcript_131131/g.327171  ORF Transcript_131131/g.327171 Transcript_131131/m.327171 type:complete len:201 (+) Transcript_131131:984-1586(+)